MINKQPVIAIFDVGKTNKKLFLFDENYHIVFERSARFLETKDEDGDACENIESLQLSVFDSLREVLAIKDFQLKAVNVSAYGASLVYLDKNGKSIAPLYNYLKEYPAQLKKQFYETYGGEEAFSFQTASPVLGSLNSGMQLYRWKYEKPELFVKIKHALHLPQYISYLISGHICSDITSIGCHTNLWNFQRNDYHNWVKKEGVFEKLAPVFPCSSALQTFFEGNHFVAGAGLHDSSAALIPYLKNFQEPFILISTGTWCISLNPFNHSPLTQQELANDCLCYLTYEGKPVKASRLFAGYEHEQGVKRIGEHFHQSVARFKSMEYNAEVIALLQQQNKFLNYEQDNKNILKTCPFAHRNLTDFKDDEEAYHQLMLDIVMQQFVSANLVLNGTNVKRIFVDGGFSKNLIYMNLLAAFFPAIEVFAASMAQATAAGAALCIHHAWNTKPLPGNLLELKYYTQNAIAI